MTGGPLTVLSDAQFIDLFESKGPKAVCAASGISPQKVFTRRRRLEQKYHRRIVAPTVIQSTKKYDYIEHPARAQFNITDGVVLVGSDGHYWPGPATCAHRAFVKFIRDMRPKAIITNGDNFDGARISRWSPIMNERKPEVLAELEAVQERLGEIERYAPRSCPLYWPFGNHDQRFESFLMRTSPEYSGVHGMSLKDHFSNRWIPCWSVWINGNIVIKHRYKGGIHATHNNTVNSGMTMITGHLHSLKVTPFNDYNGMRWGVDTGCLADPDGDQFLYYSEDNSRNHRSGFVVLTFVAGKLQWPEVCYVIDKDHVGFRGEVIKV